MAHLLYDGAHPFPERPIPEPALWSIFENLVDAMIVLRYGLDEPDRILIDGTLEAAKTGSWEPIVHRDLKYDNVFLDIPNSDVYPSYPRAVVGDFGLSVMTADDTNDAMNPYGYNGGDGTSGWRPREQVMGFNADTLKPEQVDKLGEATNVWGIGAIILHAMNQDFSIPDTQEDDQGRRLLEPSLTANARRNYSEELSELITNCVADRTIDRPKLKALKQSIIDNTSGANDLSRGMRNAPHFDGDVALKLEYQPLAQEYAIGFAG